MAANRRSGQTRREARCGAIRRAPQPTRGTESPTGGRVLLRRGIVAIFRRCWASPSQVRL